MLLPAQQTKPEMGTWLEVNKWHIKRDGMDPYVPFSHNMKAMTSAFYAPILCSASHENIWHRERHVGGSLREPQGKHSRCLHRFSDRIG